MRRVTASALVAALIAAPAFATLSEVDTDGDNFVSYEEMIAVYPDVTEEMFTEIDFNADGLVDEAEMTAALEANLIVAPTE